MEQLGLLNHYYQFALETFQLQVFDKVLNHGSLSKGSSDPFKRLNDLWELLFIEAYKRIAISLQHQDHLVYAFNLCRIKLLCDYKRSSQLISDAFDSFLGGGLVIRKSSNNQQQQETVAEGDDIASNLENLSTFKGLSAARKFIQTLESLLESSGPELKSLEDIASMKLLEGKYKVNPKPNPNPYDKK